MKNNNPPAKSLLWSKFVVTPTFIQLHDASISDSDFMEAVCEFCRANDHARSRLGDMLITYEKKFGRPALNGLVSTLALKGLASRKSCDNSRSFAKYYSQGQRLDLLPDAHAEEIWSISDDRKRANVLRKVEKMLQSGGKMPLRTVRELVRDAKKR
jgi:hypothetical protein